VAWGNNHDALFFGSGGSDLVNCINNAHGDQTAINQCATSSSKTKSRTVNDRIDPQRATTDLGGVSEQFCRVAYEVIFLGVLSRLPSRNSSSRRQPGRLAQRPCPFCG